MPILEIRPDSPDSPVVATATAWFAFQNLSLPAGVYSSLGLDVQQVRGAAANYRLRNAVSGVQIVGTTRTTPALGDTANVRVELGSFTLGSQTETVLELQGTDAISVVFAYAAFLDSDVSLTPAIPALTPDIRTTPTVATLTTWVRDHLRDPAFEADGTLKSASSLGWSDDQIRRAINSAIIELQARLAAQGDELHLRKSGTVDVVSGEADLPAGVSGTVIEAVQALVGTEFVTIHRGLTPTSMDEAASEIPTFYRWSLQTSTVLSSAASPGLRIRIEPRFTGQIVVWYWNPAAVPQATTDQHSMAQVWGELVALLAAFELLAQDEDFTTQQMMRFEAKMEIFLSFSRQRNGRIRRIPR
ncbi:MAG: hypothetical protein HC882_01450 [Acidobacteria bacterium]|nr:hypothetical protein [Acidobacteriota bacterium]